jgi:hypothetical protein
MKMKKRNHVKALFGGQIGCIAFILLANVSIGAWSVAEILSWFGKSIPWWGDCIIGLFLGEITIPVAIVGWILIICHVF